MKKMSKEEYKGFLGYGTRTGKLASVREDGRPHVAPVWFVLDGDDLVFMTWHESVKARNIARDARVSICVDEEIPPYAYVVVEGVVSVGDDVQERKYWAKKIAERYMGADLADLYGKRNSVEGELVVRLRPTKVIAQADIAGW
jgi:PPOX class probable F420-dependent enzyme